MTLSLAMINAEAAVDCLTIESGSDENTCWGVDWQLLIHQLLPTIFPAARRSSWAVLSRVSEGPWEEPHRIGGAAGGETRTI